MKYLKNYSNWLLLFLLFNDYEINDVEFSNIKVKFNKDGKVNLV